MFQKAKIFNNGNSQAVRLPKEFCFEGKGLSLKNVRKWDLIKIIFYQLFIDKYFY